MLEYRAVETECDQHEEEDNRPEDGSRERRYGLRIDDKHKTSSYNATAARAPST